MFLFWSRRADRTDTDAICSSENNSVGAAKVEPIIRDVRSTIVPMLLYRKRLIFRKYNQQGSPIGFDEGPTEVISPRKRPQVDRDNVPGDGALDTHCLPLSTTQAEVAPSGTVLVSSPTSWLKWAINAKPLTRREEASVRKFIKSNKLLFFRPSDTDNPFFRLGLRYIPPPGRDNVFRTVIIDALPRWATLDQILPRVRGGAIFSASLLDTSTISGSPSAMIVFAHQSGALNFLRRVERDGFFVGFCPVGVRPVPTPTYPMPRDLETQMKSHGRTRCLTISSRSPIALKRETYRVLSTTRIKGFVECFGERDTERQITVRFHSVRVASMACNALTNDPVFKGAFVQSTPDPCAKI